MSNWNEERRTLLGALQNMGSGGRAEGAALSSIPLSYYPVPEHLRLLDSEVVLVVGPRGSGKTQIARVLTDASLYETVQVFAPAVRLPKGESRWLRAYPAGTQSFDGIGLGTFVRAVGGETDRLRELWLAYLVRVLKPYLDDAGRSELRPLFDPPAADVTAIHKAFCDLGTKPVVVLDRLDESLEQNGQYLFATYDELDTLGHGEWVSIKAGVRGLVALWAAYSRRWRRLRAKIFLRSDLYERHAKIGGADLAKLAAGRVELVWSDRDLYGMLVKRLANVSEELSDYVRGVKGLQWNRDTPLGWIPEVRTWMDAKPVVERMVGVYMGAGQKKGLVYRWLLDHVRDGLGRGYPRPFVRLIEEGARQELQSSTVLRSPRLLSATSLRRALDRVSEDHVTQSRDEWPWIDSLQERLRSDPVVPYTEKESVKLLEGLDAKAVAPPPFEGRELLEYLLELGIFRRRPDGRLDVPDLYLAGLGLRRKGGVSKHT